MWITYNRSIGWPRVYNTQEVHLVQQKLRISLTRFKSRLLHIDTGESEKYDTEKSNLSYSLFGEGNKKLPQQDVRYKLECVDYA